MRAGRGRGVFDGRRGVSLSNVNRLSASRRFVLRSRVCRAVLWLLVLCFALDGALLAAKPLPIVVTKSALTACHQAAPQSHADHAMPDCCHGGCDCACVGAHVLAAVARLPFAVAVSMVRDVIPASVATFAMRDAAPPLRPPIA
jgi:hypothetical protein